jgi:hypothetical protein
MHPNISPAVLDDLLLAAGGRTLTDEARARLKALHWELIRRPLMLRCPIPGRFIVGDPDAPTTLDCGILAAGGAQLALANPGRSDLVRAADFADPGAAYADNSVRNGLSGFADFLEANGQRLIASAVRSIKVKGGYLVAPRNRHVDLITE